MRMIMLMVRMWREWWMMGVMILDKELCLIKDKSIRSLKKWAATQTHQEYNSYRSPMMMMEMLIMVVMIMLLIMMMRMAKENVWLKVEIDYIWRHVPKSTSSRKQLPKTLFWKDLAMCQIVGMQIVRSRKYEQQPQIWFWQEVAAVLGAAN